MIGNSQKGQTFWATVEHKSSHELERSNLDGSKERDSKNEDRTIEIIQWKQKLKNRIISQKTWDNKALSFNNENVGSTLII